MEKIRIVKLTSSLVRFMEAFTMHFGSSYSMRCESRDFAEDTTSAATLSLESPSLGAVAACALQPDPLRRGVRLGTLSLAGLELPSGRYWLHAKLAGDTVFRVELSVFSPMEAAGPSVTSAWTVVDAGDPADATLAVSDYTQVRVTPVAPSALPLDIVVTDTPFEAYVVVTSSGGFPYSDVLVNGSAPVWDRKDSLQLPSTLWTLHLVKVAGTVHASLGAGVAHGAETDGDGNLVNSMEVNS